MPDFVLIVLGLASALASLLLMLLLRRLGALAVPEATPVLADLKVSTQECFGGPFSPTSILGPAGVHTSEYAKAVSLMGWVMNQVKDYRDPTSVPTNRPLEILAQVRRGKGALCHQMASLYMQALVCAGLDGRVILGFRNIFDPYDQHTLVEARIDNRWVVMDPTFNISFADRDGVVLSAMDIKERFFEGRLDEIEVCFHGEVAYTNRWDAYYLNVFLPYNNVFVYSPGSSSLPGRLPPFRYWFGPKLYYQCLPRESDIHLRLWRGVTFLAMVVLPVFAGIFLAASVVVQ